MVYVTAIAVNAHFYIQASCNSIVATGDGMMAAMLLGHLALSAVKETNSAPENYLEKFHMEHICVAVLGNGSVVEYQYY